MNVYEYLKENIEVIKNLAKLGFVNTFVFGNMDAYEAFLKTEDTEENRSTRCAMISEKVKMQPQTILKIAAKMEKPLPN